MKKIYLIISTLFVYQIASAQITLTSTTSVPSTGDSYTMITFNSVSGVRQSGANQLWDLSSVANASTVNYSYIPKASASEAANFPQSNLVDTFNLIQSFSVLSTSSWSSEGTAFPPLNRTVYTNKREWIDFPITYGNSFNETFAGTYATFFPTTTTANRSGTILIKADAYGTLKLPYATVNNVLRVTNIANYTEVAGSVTDNHVDTIYSWFNATTKTPIATYNLFYKNGNLDFEGGGYLNQADIVIGINDYETSNLFTMYPIPATNELLLHFKNSNSFNTAKLSIINMQGKTVVAKEISNNGKTYKVNISGLSKGIYMLKLNDSNKIITKKFIKK